MTMRDILCRAKRDWDFCWYDTTPKEVKNKNEWVYGYFTLNSSILANGKAIIEDAVEDYKVLDDTVCQYTGIKIPQITDRLKYVELYEKDICELNGWEVVTESGEIVYRDFLGVIEWIYSAFWFVAYKIYKDGKYEDINSHIIPLYKINLENTTSKAKLRILGNTIDNPELIRSDTNELKIN